MINMVEYDSGPHREMAVDVPDSFVPRNKTPPRYPPTSKSATMTSSLSNNNKTPNKSGGRAGNGSTTTLPGHSTTQNGAPGSKPIPPPRINEKDGWSVNNNNTQAPSVLPRTLSPNKSAEVSPSTDQADRIRKYQVRRSDSSLNIPVENTTEENQGVLFRIRFSLTKHSSSFVTIVLKCIPSRQI